MRSFRKACESLFARVARPGLDGETLTEYYVHTWTSLGAGMGKNDPLDQPLDVNAVMEAYRPVFLAVEEHNPESWPPRSMFRKIQLAHEAVVSSGREYDMVIRARPDSFFTANVPLHSMMEPGVVYLPSRADFGGVCDQFAVGDPTVMGVYSRLWSTVEKHDHFHPETRLKKYLESLDVRFEMCGSIQFKIMRSDGSLYDTMSLG